MVTRHANALVSGFPKENGEKRVHAHRTATLGLTGRPLRVAITAASVTGFSLFGYDQGLMSSIITSQQFAGSEPGNEGEFPILSASAMSAEYQGGTTACYEIGCFFGALFVLACGDAIGRKPLIMSGMVIFIIGALISTCAYGSHWGLGQFIIGRVISGLGNGFATATIPVWQSEMARPERRGLLVQMEGSVVAIGTMIAYWFDFGLSFINSSIAWRFPVALQIVFALVVLIATTGLPESSRWLVAKGRHDEARTVLARVNRAPEDDPEVERLLSMQQFDAAAAGQSTSFKDLLNRGRTANLQRALIGASTQIGQQLSGCNAAIYYATVLFENIFRNSGQSERAQRVMSTLLGSVFSCVYALFTFPAYYLVDALGRRKLFFLGVCGQGASFFIAFGCLVANASRTNGESASGEGNLQEHFPESVVNQVTEVQKGAAVALFLFIAFFGCSILGLPWIYPPEINPLKTRAQGAALSTCSNWLFNFAVVMFTPIFIAYKDWACYLFFALVNMSWLPVIFFFYPETAGRSLEEIDIIFARAHEENKQPWIVAYQMPKLSDDEIRKEAYRLGLMAHHEGSPGYEGASAGSEKLPQEAASHRSSISELSVNGGPNQQA